MSARPNLDSLLQDGVVLLDGGMGSALMARGLPPGTPPDLWNLERPDEVRAVHAAYVAAGSVVVQTNTFGASPLALARHGLDGHAEEINRAGVRIARAAAGEDRLVAGDVGPSGLLLAPLGEATPEALEAAFAVQAAALAAAGADYIAIETMSDLAEALCAVRGARRATDLPVTACLTFDRRRRGYFTLMGDRPSDAVRALADAGATAVGANCGLASDHFLALCAELVGATDLPVIAKPNAGLPDVVDGRAVYAQDPSDFARDVAAMVRGGVRAVGGCCGTDARFIAALEAALAGLRASARGTAADGGG